VRVALKEVEKDVPSLIAARLGQVGA